MSEPAGPIRVLHVDDQPDFGQLVATLLEHEDERLRVGTATSAGEAMDRLAGAEVDCLVSDYDTPRTNGLELLEAVREVDERLPFILFTGKGSEEIASEAISAGVTDYLQKQAGSDQYTILSNRILNYVERARVQRNERRHLDMRSKPPTRDWHSR